MEKLVAAEVFTEVVWQQFNHTYLEAAYFERVNSVDSVLN
jgi:hypothetical protein